MSTLSRKETIVKSTSEMMDVTGGNREDMFKDACSQFGGLDITRTLLIHEAKERNNMNATEFLGKSMDTDYDRCVKRAGKKMNQLSGKFNVWVNYRQVQSIRAEICTLYQQMIEWDIEITRRGFSFPVEVEDESE